jgi:acyl-coenzyme A thioesterase PaaI-like protein
MMSGSAAPESFSAASFVLLLSAHRMSLLFGVARGLRLDYPVRVDGERTTSRRSYAGFSGKRESRFEVFSIMKEEIANPYPDNRCFFCGYDNPIGLKLKFYWDKEKEETYTEYDPDEHFVGQGDILHGAIQMGLLDEIMGWTCYVFSKQMSVTSDFSVKFHRPTYICAGILRVTCRIISNEGSKVYMSATLSNHAGEQCTTATGTFHILPEDRFHRLVWNPNRAKGSA